MKLIKEAFEKSLDRGMERAKELQKTWEDNVDAAEAEYERTWREELLPQWSAFYEAIGDALEAGTPITAAMLPRTAPKGLDRYTNSAILLYEPFDRGHFRGTQWFASHNYGPPPQIDLKAYEALKDFLASVDDTTITTNQLERVGFRNLSKVVTSAQSGFWEQ